VLGTVDAGLDRAKLAQLQRQKDRIDVATYYRQRYTRAVGSTLTRIERPSRRS
jgi:hypothetical protein